MRTSSPARAVGLAAWGAGAPAYVPNVADPGWGKVMAAAVWLSVVATTGWDRAHCPDHERYSQLAGAAAGAGRRGAAGVLAVLATGRMGGQAWPGRGVSWVRAVSMASSIRRSRGRSGRWFR
jgi:hypothetical protein